jgi:anti-anti-sigma factor
MAASRENNGAIIVRPDSTRVTAGAGADQVRALISDAIESGHIAIAIDFTGVEFIDSSMIGVLVGSFKKIHPEGGSLVIFGAGEAIRDLFRATVIDHIVDIVSDEQAALLLLEEKPKNRAKGLWKLFS